MGLFDNDYGIDDSNVNYDYGQDYGNSQDFGYDGAGDTNYWPQESSSFGNTLGEWFGKGGTVPQFIDNYGGAIKGGMGLLGGLYGLNKGNEAAGQMRGLGQQQQAFGQQQMANSQEWNQYARNAANGLDPRTQAAMAQAQQASERQSNARGINPIHSRIAAQQAMSGPQLAGVDSYGRLAGMFNQGSSAANASAGQLYNQANAAGAGGRQEFGQGAGYITGPSGDNQLLAALLKNLGRG